MKTVVLATHGADLRERAALDRALRLLPARIVRVETAERWTAARRLAEEEAGCEWVGFVDDDAIVAADAFGALARVFASGATVIGGRAMVAGEQRFGEMLGTPRWGPDPAELCPITAPRTLGNVAEAMRGPMDVVARGVVFVAARFVREAGAELDPWALHLALSLLARTRGITPVCEPRMTFTARPDPAEVSRRVPALLRAAVADWTPGELHRDPPGPRERVIGREIRVAGNIRGYERRPYPPLSLLVVGERVAPKTLSALRLVTAAAEVATCAPDDADELRRRLRRCGDRYLLVLDAKRDLTRAEFVALVERVERSGCFALALDRDDPQAATALFHLGRIPADARLPGAGVRAVVAGAVDALPARRLFAVTASGPAIPAVLSPLARPRTIAFVMLATSRPGVTRQSFDALSQTMGLSRAIAVIPAGAATARKVLSAWPNTEIVEDGVDPNLGHGLNHVLATVGTDLVLVLRDDVQVPRRTPGRLAATFERLPGLGAVGPRVNGLEQPQGLTDVTYRDLEDMEFFAERRAASSARESFLVPFLHAPVLLLARELLDVVGGFDPKLGFTRFGVVDFTRRARLANVPIACADDAFAHLFPLVGSESLLGASDSSTVLAGAFEKRWKERTVFEPERDRISLQPLPARSERAPEVTVVVPVADPGEWERVRAAVRALAVSFTVDDPVEIAIGLDGTLELGQAARAIHDILADAPVAMERTVNVRIEPVADIAAWAAGGGRSVRLRETSRAELASLPAVDGVTAVRALLLVRT